MFSWKGTVLFEKDDIATCNHKSHSPLNVFRFRLGRRKIGARRRDFCE